MTVNKQSLLRGWPKHSASSHAGGHTALFITRTAFKTLHLTGYLECILLLSNSIVTFFLNEKKSPFPQAEGTLSLLEGIVSAACMSEVSNFFNLEAEVPCPVQQP